MEPAVNLTNTPSPGASDGQCNDDDYLSLVAMVDNNMHIIYINYKDAGGIPQREDTWTNSPVMYLSIPNVETESITHPTTVKRGEKAKWGVKIHK